VERIPERGRLFLAVERPGQAHLETNISPLLPVIFRACHIQVEECRRQPSATT
jgi:hypothetical protein